MVWFSECFRNALIVSVGYPTSVCRCLAVYVGISGVWCCLWVFGGVLWFIWMISEDVWAAWGCFGPTLKDKIFHLTLLRNQNIKSAPCKLAKNGKVLSFFLQSLWITLYIENHLQKNPWDLWPLTKKTRSQSLVDAIAVSNLFWKHYLLTFVYFQALPKLARPIGELRELCAIFWNSLIKTEVSE